MYLSGTDEYITHTVEAYSPAMLRAAYSVLGNKDDAEDAVQDAFIKLMQTRPVFNNGQHEKAWLIRVTVNISKNMLRRIRRENAEPDINAAAEQTEENTVLGAVLSLPPKYRAVIHLYYYEGYSIKEIAAILNIPAASVGTLLSRGRKKLEKLLKGEDET